MSVFRSIVFSAVVAGLIAGAVVTILQQFGTVPLILKGEVFEQAAEKTKMAETAAAPHQHQHVEHDHGDAAWEPRDGFERNAFTAAANILTGIGFALLLSGIYALRDHPVTWREGLLWGLAGFAIFTVAPGLGLPPELPGVPAAPLLPRQIWWIATAAATAGGLGLVVFWRSAWAIVLGIALIILPHLVGAPELAGGHTDVPAALSRQFIVAVTLTSLVFWVLLGSLTSVVYRRFATTDAAKP
jgi:cobalt transporter subunit CbtA